MSEINSSFIELSAVKSPAESTQYTAADVRRNHCENWRKSGLSMSEYCRRCGLSVSSLSGWIKKFNGTSATESKIKPERILPPAKRQGMEIILVSGIRLRFSEMGNISEILRLLKALESCS